MTAKVRFGVIGCGVAAWMGHLPWIWGHPEAELTAVCDSDIQRAEQARERYGAGVALTDYNELLSHPEIDAVCICTPPSSHYEITMAAAASKKHILLEKPMARSERECLDILAAAESHGVFLMMGHEKRFNLACERVKQILDSGLIGQAFYLVVHWGSAVKLAPDQMIPAGYRQNYEWRWKDKSVGGGILQDHLPHYVDLWRWWTGAEIETVTSEIQNVTRDYLGRDDGVWEDFGTVMMRFSNGAIGVFDSGTVGRSFSPLLQNGSGIGEWSEFGYIHGTQGQIAFDLTPWDSPDLGRIMVWSLDDRQQHDRGWYQVEMPSPRRAPGGPLSPATNDLYMFHRQIDHFIQCIRTKRTPAIGGFDGLATLRVIEAAYESQRIGQKVKILQY